MPFLDEIAARLVAQGVGTLGTGVGLANSIYCTSKAIIPTGVGPYLTIIETGGSGSAKTQNNTATQRPTASLTARAATYTAARAMLVAAYNALGGANGLYNVVLSGVTYLSIVARQEPTDVGMDDSTRPMIVFNIAVEKQPS